MAFQPQVIPAIQVTTQKKLDKIKRFFPENLSQARIQSLLYYNFCELLHMQTSMEKVICETKQSMNEFGIQMPSFLFKKQQRELVSSAAIT